MKKHKYEIVVLLSSIAVMILDLTATRVLSPYVGTSNIVWTSIIGIILASMAIGYYLGGILTEKNVKLILVIIISILLSLTSFYLSKNIFKTNNPNVLLDKDTEYNCAIVSNLDDNGGNRYPSPIIKCG